MSFPHDMSFRHDMSFPTDTSFPPGSINHELSELLLINCSNLNKDVEKELGCRTPCEVKQRIVNAIKIAINLQNTDEFAVSALIALCKCPWKQIRTSDNVTACDFLIRIATLVEMVEKISPLY